MVSIVASFLCSLWEATLLSITPSYAQLKLSEGTRTGRKLQAFKAEVDRPLAAILTLNTIAHTAGAIGVGAQATLIWSEANPLITSVLVPVVMTLAILTFLYAWNDYLWPLVSAQQREYFTITLGLASIQSNFAQSEGLGRVMASGVIASLPVVILFLVFQRYVVQAMTAGGSKG